MGKRLIIFLLAGVQLLFLISMGLAQTTEITNGLSYLQSTQSPEGYWGDVAEVPYNSFINTCTVVETLNYLNETDATYNLAIQWINSTEVSNNDYLFTKMLVLSQTGFDVSTIRDYLLSVINDDSGWGVAEGFESDIKRTALALQALKAINHPDLNTINSALFYLIDNQNSDGGWGFTGGDDASAGSAQSSNVYMTALVSMTLQRFPLTVDLATAINNATDYLIAHQNPDGGFPSAGSGPGSGSEVYATALAYIALVSITTDATVLGNAVNYLLTTQLPNGSWNDDPYSTALALRALYFSENKPPPPPQLTTGTVTGKVVDASTNQPLGQVSVISGQLSATTTNTGNFTLSDIPAGIQTIDISLTGYVTATVTVDVTAGSIVDVGTIPLPIIPVAGIIKGIVTDADNNAQPLEGVTITVTGSFNGSTLTDINGDYIFTNVTPGSVTLTASKAGYFPVTASGTVVAGGVLFFSPQLSSQPPQVLTGSLSGEVFDSLTMQPIQGATVALLAGPSASTDAQGVFLIEGIAPDTYQVNISATGYTSQTYQVMIMEGVTTDLQRIYLVASLDSITVTGIVIDASTGEPIANADVTVVETGQSVKTSLSGSYTLSNINLSEFILKASFIGYNSWFYPITITTNGTYTVDFALEPSQAGDLRITSFSTDMQSYQSYEDVVISATILNEGSTDAHGLVLAEIQDIEGTVIALVSPADPHIFLTPMETIQTVIQWNTGQFSPGDYLIILKLTDPETISNLNPIGDVVAESETSISIFTTLSIEGSIALNPPVTLVDLQTPVDISAAIRNTGNVPVSATMVLEASINQAVVYSTQVTTTELQVNHIEEFILGSFTPQQDGDYVVTLKPLEPEITSDISTTLYVGPHATAVFTVTPEEATPGNVDALGKITLTGISAETGAVEDPLVPLIKDAIQKGVDWEQVNALNWQNTKNCYGCHVQTQTLIGLELSRDKVTVDDNKTIQLLNFMKSCQVSEGYVAYSPGNPWQQYPIEATTLYAWSLSYYHDETQIQDVLTRALDYLIPHQNASGYWVSDYYYGLNDWWNDLGQNQPSTPFTTYNIIALSKAFQLTGISSYKNSLLSAAEYLNTADHTTSIITAAHILIGLKTALPFIDDVNLQTDIETKIDSIIQYLNFNQNIDSGWPRYTGNQSDSLPTAHVLYALSLAGVEGTNPVLRNGTTYLINSQNPDGTWSTEFIRQATYPDKHFGATTWAIISLPLTLEAIAGVEADLTVTLPLDITLNNSSPTPTDILTSGQSTEYIWNFKYLDFEGKDLLMDLTVKDLMHEEERAVAEDAYISFKHSQTGETITIPIDIPTVTGIAPVTVEVTTDRVDYTANEDVTITTTITNISQEIRNPSLMITIEDTEGNVVDEIADFQIDNLLPPNYLQGWNNRIRLRIDHTKIDADLFDFPVRIHLSASSGINSADVSGIFDELGANRKKIAVISSDSTTQSYVEIERWDEVNKEADLWVNIPFISSSADTILYLYYDSAQADNTAYVGNTGDAVTENVWNSNYKAVWHMSQDPSGAMPQLSDSTSNNNDGTSNGGMTSSDLVDGLVSKAIDFDGVDDYVNIPETASIDFQNADDFSISFWIKTGSSNLMNILSKHNPGGWNGYMFFMNNTNPGYCNIPGHISFYVAASAQADACSDNAVNDGNWHYVTGVYTPNTVKLYVDGAAQSDVGTRAGNLNNNVDLMIGPDFEGSIDEVTISHFAYSDAWIKASFQSQSDSLISFGSAESINNIYTPSTQTYVFTWNTGTTFSGDYLVRAVLNENGALIAEDTASFTILAEKSVNSSISTDKISYPANQPVTITSQITSTSPNYIFENLVANVSVVSSLGEILYIASNAIPILVPDQLVEFSNYWNTGQNPEGTYTVNLEVLGNPAVLSASTADFDILGTNDTGEGLTGTITASPDPVEQGIDETITYTITNNGNEDITNLNVTILIVDPDTQAVMTQNISQYALAIGESVTEILTISTSDLLPKTYLAILQASTDVMPVQTLASTTFEVVEAPGPDVEITKTVPDITNLLVWVNKKCKDGDNDENDSDNEEDDGEGEHGHGSSDDDNNGDNDDDSNDDNNSEEECIRLDLLEDILSQASADYYIVYDKKDFQRELRSPYYTDFLILGEHHSLEDHFWEEVREQVYSGKGIVSSLWLKHGEHDSDFFGAKHKGHLSGDEHEVELLDSPITGTGTLNVTGKAVKLEADEDTIIAGWITGDMDDNEDGGHGHSSSNDDDNNNSSMQYPAIVLNNYGNGKTIYYAFDLGKTLNDENYSQLSELIINSISYVHNTTDASAVYPYNMVPVEIGLTSLGGAFDLRITETYPEVIKLYDPLALLGTGPLTGEWITENPWVMDILLEPDEIKTVLYYALTPDIAGTYTLNTEIGYMDGGIYNFYQELNLDITVDRSADVMAGDIISALNALTLSGGERSKRDKAVREINEVQNRTIDSEHDIEKNIKDIRKAVDSLLHIKSVDISDIRFMMDELLKVWESRYYFEIY